MTTKPRQVLVFQHIDVEHPGIFRDFLAEDGIAWRPVELDAGEPIPDLRDFDALWVMGGPMDVWQEDAHPWLVAEKCAIRQAVIELHMPYLGFCLGHQLLGAALGGKVGLAAEREVGILPVELTPAGRSSGFLTGMPPRFDALQWHSAEVSLPPPGAAVLASSPLCAVQAMSCGAHAFSMQFHLEITRTTVADWNAVPEYCEALLATLGADGASRLEAEAQARAQTFNDLARRLYVNWKAHAWK